MDKNSVEVDKSSVRILLAEDNDYNYLLVKAILKGYTLVRVINGAEAVIEVKEGYFDLVLMDVKMPVMNGLDAARNIREFNKDIPIIAVTANVSESDRKNAFNAGCDGFLVKPFLKKDLLEAVNCYSNIVE